MFTKKLIFLVTFKIKVETKENKNLRQLFKKRKKAKYQIVIFRNDYFFTLCD